MKLKGSVGRKGINFREDVELVQIALNRAMRSPLRLLSVDKMVGKKTISAIEIFQQQVLRFAKPDGLIGVEGRTWKSLSKYLTKPAQTRITSHVIFPEFLNIKADSKAEPFSMLPTQNTLKIAWGAKVSPEFKRKVVQISKELQLSADFLMACMAFAKIAGLIRIEMERLR